MITIKLQIIVRTFFSTNASLRRHYAIHSGEKRFKCEQCGKAFRQTAHLKTHRKQHGIGLIEAFTCNICNKEFMQKGSLKTHMWSHMRDGDKPFKCSYCNKGFLWKNQMENHFKMRKCSWVNPRIFNYWIKNYLRQWSWYIFISVFFLLESFHPTKQLSRTSTQIAPGQESGELGRNK